jgi:hypothetical protein
MSLAVGYSQVNHSAIPASSTRASSPLTLFLHGRLLCSSRHLKQCGWHQKARVIMFRQGKSEIENTIRNSEQEINSCRNKAKTLVLRKQA